MPKLYKRMQPLLGTFVEIGVPASEGSFLHLEKALSAAFTEIRRLQNLLSFHQPESELSQLNNSFGNEVILSPTTIVALKLAKFLTEQSSEYFNFTLGGSLVQKGILPNHFSRKFKQCGKATDVQIRGYTVKLERNICISLDGIAKGLAVDFAVRQLKNVGIFSGFINAGGDMKIFGDLELPIVQQSHLGEQSYLGLFSKTALATSQVSSKSDQKFLAKIESTKTKVISGIWTVQAPSSWLADALTKVAALAPESEKQRLFQKFGATHVQPEKKAC